MLINMQLYNSAEIAENSKRSINDGIRGTEGRFLLVMNFIIKWCKRFKESVNLILDDTGRG